MLMHKSYILNAIDVICKQLEYTHQAKLKHFDSGFKISPVAKVKYKLPVP